ncbi:hypothetical protein B5X24_HaOG216553 [Helicoverpa armigera]|uniref:Nuclear receptor domain-containing protein n=1 Tax=Helicoverpa armigera TaxID=29058 RepID=A0A2W1CMW9_HELAM|nr:hypothetical protein B5X24_HaOG216553 [Helicoverpa armigera]
MLILNDILTFIVPRCPICEDVTSGVHYGVRTCESCKLFFKRTVQLDREASYSCIRSYDCMVNVQTRAWCKLCRFNKCLNAGMNTRLVKKLMIDPENRPRQLIS